MTRKRPGRRVRDDCEGGVRERVPRATTARWRRIAGGCPLGDAHWGWSREQQGDTEGNVPEARRPGENAERSAKA